MNIFKKFAYGASAIAASVPMIVSAAVTLPTEATEALPESSLVEIITGIMNWLLIVVGIMGVIGFVIAGIIYLTAAGDDSRIEKGKQAMVFSIVGVIVALIGVVVIRAVEGMLGSGGSGTF